ncbi:hypothetical protein [Fimbriimonas ginsengisoli]|uniref:Cytochrome c family protein n=1 Tax=Fimbriimonas ginsengisoli Gsoil 348 TaxID=661478 RepID=A0A068NM22_FIMGI|nr:hypothetical protein [Fimbriimonas ginsengisoli]AIE84467.1 Cytochrome c family protein [Fimbriimonas ginsengisoli Gsoil 348]
MGLIAATAILSAGILTGMRGYGRQSFPQNPYNMCPLDKPMFDGWFASGQPSLNGRVVPADSLGLDTSTNQNFYRWSYQMFLWLTSPTGTRIDKDGKPTTLRTFFSPGFYDVSSKGADGMRVMTPYGAGTPHFGLRTGKPGPDNLPAVFDRQGHRLKVVRAQLSAHRRPIVKLANGKAVEIAKIKTLAGEAAQLLDTNGHTLQKLSAPVSRTVQMVTIGGHRAFVNAAGQVVPTETGQADGSVQLTQKGALVYYSIAVNDLYAYFLTMTDPSTSKTDTYFPTTPAQLQQVLDYGRKHGKTFTNPEALTVEVKAAWVSVAAVAHPENYMTMVATVPIYKAVSPTQWSPTGKSESIRLALVGLHVVGSSKGHPEMLWASFEHFDNAPNDSFAYLASDKSTQTWPRSTAPVSGGSWLFSANGATSGLNVAKAKVGGPKNESIVSPTTAPIGPGTAIRFTPFGAANDVPPNQKDSVAESNSQILSLNQNVAKLMPGGDLRNQYHFLGCTWTNGGVVPTTPYPGTVIGTSYLSNSTMETFTQKTGNSKTMGIFYGCMFCHDTNTTSVSHIFTDTRPLVLAAQRP